MISFYAGNFSDIASDPVQESGDRILFAEDSGDLFLERSGTRVRIQDVIRIDTESEREAILAPLDKIYFVTESRKLWSYISGNWFLLNEEGENPSGDFFGEDPPAGAVGGRSRRRGRHRSRSRRSSLGRRRGKSRFVLRLNDGFPLFHFHFVYLSVQCDFIDHCFTSASCASSSLLMLTNLS